MDVLEKAQELERRGEQIIHLEVGEPDFDTPECINEAGYRAICDGKTHYTHSLGLIELREAIAEDYWKKYRVKVSPEQILIASGTSPAMLLLFSALLEPGDEVILSNPYYPCYPNIIRFVDGSPVFVEVKEEEGFQYLPEMIEEKLSPRVKGIMINSPSNPTGNVMPAERMEQIAKFSPFIISDEIYHGLVYEGEAHSILEFTDRAFVINGFSKLYAMTGWRLGYVIAPKEFIRPMQKIQQNLFISASSFAQWGALAGLKEAEEDIQKMKETYDRRRRFLIPRLRELGIWNHGGAHGSLLHPGQCKTIFPGFLSLCLRHPERGKGRSGTGHRFRDKCRRISPILLRQFHGKYRGRDEQAGEVSGTL